MHFIEINSKQIGPYLGIKYPNGKIVGDILPIIYDEAIIDLQDSASSYALCYKVSKNLMGQEIDYADLVDMNSGETFSYQVNNIFFLRIIQKDPKVIALIGNELRLYEKFSKQTKKIEADGDKKSLTPLGYFDMFVSYDGGYYYPEIFNDKVNKEKEITRFYDYFGYKSYIDGLGNKHLVMFLETDDSTESNPKWYFFDNFKKISEVIRFQQFIGNDDEEYVENWHIDSYGIINFEATTSGWYHIDPVTQKMIQGKNISGKNNFLFTRSFEDTDINIIVGKNENGYFLIDRTKTDIDHKSLKNIKYFENFIKFKKVENKNLFFFLEKTGDVIVVDEKLKELYYTDLAGEENMIVDINIVNEILEVQLSKGEIRKYFKNK